MSWFSRRKESFLQASSKEKEAAIEKLIEQGSFRGGYYFMLVLSTLIITPGIFLDDYGVLIGGMILAPLMIPVMSLSLSIVSGNVNGCLRSLRIFITSIAIALLASYAMTLVLDEAYGTLSWDPSHVPSAGVYIFIAFCSGLAGAIACVKEDMAPAVAGVAAAVALLPPLCNAGIGLAMGKYVLMQSALVIFASNFAGVVMAACLVFWIFGFVGFDKVEEEVIRENVGQ